MTPLDPIPQEQYRVKQLKAIHENCSGCGTCRLVCAIENFRLVNPSLAALRIEGRFPAPGDYRIHLCDQCGQCAEVCPVDAIAPDDAGVYRIDDELCTGCLTCVDACPHGVIAVGSHTDVPIKCTLCGACVEACPRDAIVWE
jgi:ferredoxin